MGFGPPPALAEPSDASVRDGPVGLPGSTTASPRDPNHAPHAAITFACSASPSAMPPPWYASRYLGIAPPRRRPPRWRPPPRRRAPAPRIDTPGRSFGWRPRSRRDEPAARMGGGIPITRPVQLG